MFIPLLDNEKLMMRLCQFVTAGWFLTIRDFSLCLCTSEVYAPHVLLIPNQLFGQSQTLALVAQQSTVSFLL